MSDRALVVEDGPQAGQRFPIEGELTIGREHADCTISDEEVSRRHAIVRASAGDVTIEDLGSTNGTWVNGTRIAEAVALRDRDRVRVGRTTLAVELPGSRTVISGTIISPAPTAPPAPTVERQTPAPVPIPAPAPPPAPEPERRAPEEPFNPEVGSVAGEIATRDVRVEILTFATVGGTAIGVLAYFLAR